MRRELFEEVGVRAGAVTYHASQPWPFPSPLMIGCFAECESRDLVLDPNEIAEARMVHTRARRGPCWPARYPDGAARSPSPSRII